MSAPICNNENNHSSTPCMNNQDAIFRTDIPPPISKLPVELLSKIFHLNGPYSPPSFMEDSEMANKEHFRSTLGWVAVSWVCQSWRRIALNDSTLWCELPLSFPKWTTVMLERSRNAGFMVNLDMFSFSSRGREIILPAIFANASRVAELVFCAEGPEDALDLVVHFLSTPKLSTLRLSTGAMFQSLPAIDLPSNLFHNTTRLRYLNLEGFNINWDSHLLSNPLHTLILSGVSLSARPTISKFRSIFKTLSFTLKVLKLRGAFPIPSRAHQDINPALQRSPSIHLPLLESIELSAAPCQLLSFFGNISPGDSMKDLRIATAYDHPSRPAFHNLLVTLRGHSFVAQLLSGVEYLQIFWVCRELKFFAFNGGFSTRHSLSALDTSTKNGPSDLYLDIAMRRMTASQQPEIAASIIEDVFHGLRWTTLRKLEMINLDDVASPRLGDVLRRTFGTLSALHTLKVSDAVTASSIVNILRTDSRATLPNTTAIPFAGLKELFISHSSFRPFSRHKVKISQLRRAARDRSELGIPIEKIELTYSPGLEEKDVDSLKKYVANTNWDRYDETDCESEHYDTDESGEEDSDEEAC